MPETEERSYRPETLPAAAPAPAKTRFGRWLLFGQRLDRPSDQLPRQAWYRVLWLTGVDYFSSLAYQPGIALLAAGALSPIATVLIVGLTLFGALPVYAHVAARSHAGQGTIALLEGAVEGWRGKVLVLSVLGFACTAFVLTISISAADAARHAVENPLFHSRLEGRERLLTVAFLIPLCGVFLGGFRRAVGWAMAVAIPYVILTAVVITRGFIEIAGDDVVVQDWHRSFASYGDWTSIFVASAIVFPKLALGLSGFETSLSIMPHVKGDADDVESDPRGRVRATRTLLLAAAVLMSALLLTSSIVATLLVSQPDYAVGGPAEGRVLSFLAHRLLGSAFGTIYDVATMLILWFAAANGLLGMLNLIPRYLPRFGMAPNWVSFRRPLVLALSMVSIGVALSFGGDVERMGAPYAMGVLGLLGAGAVAVAIALWHQRLEETTPRRIAWAYGRFVYMCLAATIFAYALIDTIIESPGGFLVVLGFPLAILFFAGVSRAWRSTELRVSDLTLPDLQSAMLWKAMVGKKVHVAPLRTSSREARRAKAEEIRRQYKVDGPLAFIHVNLVDNRSDFFSPLQAVIRREDDNYVVEVSGAVAIANTIAYISELIDPRSIFLGLTQQDLVAQSIKYILWGEGETGLMVYMILLRHWAKSAEDDVRPNIFLTST